MDKADQPTNCDKTRERICYKIAEKTGKPVPAVNSLIAGTGIAHHLTIVTRNTADMKTAVRHSSTPGNKENNKETALFSRHHGRHIRFWCGNRFDVEFFNQGRSHTR